jgi:hypothetical protein
LPHSLLQLCAGNVAAVDCLLPLTRLQSLSLSRIEDYVMTVADLCLLRSSITSLTRVDFNYAFADGDLVEAAASSWGVLPLQHLGVQAYARDMAEGYNMQRSVLPHLSSLTGLQSLGLGACCIVNVQPETLADLLGQLSSLRKLQLNNQCYTTQQQQQQLAQAGVIRAAGEAGDAAGSFLTRMLRRLSSKLGRRLFSLSLKGIPVGKAEAAALAGMQGLVVLQLPECDLEDCYVADIMSALHRTLQCLDIADNPRVTDASLPMLARLMPGMKVWQLKRTGVTEEGLRQFLPCASD